VQKVAVAADAECDALPLLQSAGDFVAGARLEFHEHVFVGSHQGVEEVFAFGILTGLADSCTDAAVTAEHSISLECS